MGRARGADVIANLPYELPIVCLVIGLLGAALGGWICARGYEKRFEAQRKAFEFAREKAERDLQRAFSCVPQWMQQTVRVEFELLGIQSPPQMYQVVMLNDDYTPMEFVVVVIQEFFNKDRETATQIMLKIHLDGKGVCGVYSRDVAATKVQQVQEAARQAGIPCSVSVNRLTEPGLEGTNRVLLTSKAEGNHMIAQELEVSLHMAFVEARQQRHEFITVEHLLLALLDNPSAAEVLRACSANIDDLRKSLANFIKDNTPQVAGTDDVDTQPTLGSSA
jgi:ATP-dependent Clp protease adapter protein ClpS